VEDDGDEWWVTRDRWPAMVRKESVKRNSPSPCHSPFKGRGNIEGAKGEVSGVGSERRSRWRPRQA
jgi:hypothetical protein